MKLLKLGDLTHFWGNVRKHIPTKTSDLTNDSNFAVDSNVLHKTGDETSSGFKTFSSTLRLTAYPSIRMYMSDDEWDVQPAETKQSEIRFTDKNSVIISYFGFQHRSDNSEPFRTCWRQRKMDGTSSYFSIDFNNLGNFYPENDNAITLGGTSNRWKSIYATNYYYGANNVEFSDKFVTADTAQTVSGAKTFSDDTFIKSLNFANEVASTSSSSSAVMPFITTVTYTDQTASKSARLNLRITAGGDKSLYPHENNQYALGLASRKWSEVHGVTYYYGADNTEFSTKFVTTDTAQTISGVKTFSNYLNISNTDTTATTPQITLKNSKVTKSSTTETGAQLIYFTDKNNAPLSIIESRAIANGNTSLMLKAYNLDTSNDSVSGGLQIVQAPSGTYVLPTTDEAVAMGNSLFKWSDVGTKRINNLQPSALALPMTRDNAIDISSYFTNFNNGDTNQYTPTVNGWIYLETTGCNALHCFCTTGNLVHYGNTVARASDGMAYVTFPVLANNLFKCTWYSNTTITLSRAWFIPCQGNV